MSSTPLSSDTAPDAAGAGTIPMRFEVTTLPVADVDRAKAFYQRLGWRFDIDFEPAARRASGAVHAARLAGLHPVREGLDHDDDRRCRACCSSSTTSTPLART